MKRLIVRGVIMVIVLSALASPLIAAAGPDKASPVSVTLDFQWIRQGHVGVAHVNGSDLADVRAVFQDRVYLFYPDGARFTGLISADMEEDIGTYTMQLWVRHTDESTERIDQPVEVNYGDFGSVEVTLSASLMPLMEPEVEQAEMDRLFNIMNRVTPERYWADSGFIPASTAEMIGYFGTWRLYNGTYWRRHTGLDYRVPIGTPIIAVANGRVMLAEDLAIRGGYILIDHGWGIYSGYAHLSEKLVVPGQWVRQGDVIGLSGLNGRSSGAHLHWEMAVGGAWVEPADFVAMGLGTAAP